MSPVHKYITSLFCLSWLRCVVKSFGNKLREKTVVATNSSSPSPCSAPKPQSLCSDHSGFPMFRTDTYDEHSDQVSISHLLPEPVPSMDVTPTFPCRQKAMHHTESTIIHHKCGKGIKEAQCKHIESWVTTDRQLRRMKEQWIIQWYIFWRTVFGNVVTARKSPEQIPVLPWLEGVWQLKNSINVCTPVPNQERGQPHTLHLLFSFQTYRDMAHQNCNCRKWNVKCQNWYTLWDRGLKVKKYTVCVTFCTLSPLPSCRTAGDSCDHALKGTDKRTYISQLLFLKSQTK